MKHTNFFAWQIEITSRCPLSCLMCAKSAAATLPPRDMSFEEFQGILPFIQGVENVVLEGWGESLLHTELSRIIRAVKERNARTGFVTCGAGLNERKIKDLLEAGVDFIGFSLAGAKPETHNSIRVGSDFDRLIKSIEIFIEISKKMRSHAPRMHIVYLLLKSNLHELPGVLALARRVGIKEVIVAHIIHAGNKWQDDQRVFGCRGGESQADELLKRAAKEARRLKISLHVPAISPQEIAVCAENPLQNLYISAEGEISPCVFLNPPLTSPFLRYFCGSEHQVERLTFGNIFTTPFEEIWNSPSYMAFRARFVERKEGFDHAYRSLLRMVPPKDICLSEPPEPCRSCHKILGV
jgi:MoaA/NifB/PqqE/SkfB family radical SAM enzyme